MSDWNENDESSTPEERERPEQAQPADSATPKHAPPPATPPPWPTWLPPGMEIRPRRRRFRGCLLIILGLVVAAALVVVLGGPGGFSELPVLSGGSGGAPLQEEYVGGDPQAEATIAVVDVKGVIISADHFDAASVPRITAALKHAAARPDVVAVVLDMNTPGGEVTASDEIHHAVQQLRRTGKPVITCMRSIAASGGYYVAAGTDYIVANRLTLTGSIGVLISSVNYAELLDKIGVRADIYKSGEMKDLLNGAVERTPEEENIKDEFLQNMVDRTYMEFAEVVAEGRDFTSAEHVREAAFGDGRVLSGEQAQAFDLVDQLGYFSDAVNHAMEIANVQRAKVVRLRHRVSVVDRLLGMSANSALLPESVLPAEIRAIKPGRLYYLAPLSAPRETSP